MTEFGRYDPYAPIADGRTVIEASAGTGKTFTIAAVVTRLVAEEGLPLERILVVTFTRAATAELKDRVAAAGHAHPRRAPRLAGRRAGRRPHPRIARRRPRQPGVVFGPARGGIDPLRPRPDLHHHGFALRLPAKARIPVPGSQATWSPVIDELLAAPGASDLVVDRFAVPRPEDRSEQVTQEHLAQIGKVVVTIPDARTTPEPCPWRDRRKFGRSWPGE